MHTSSSSSSSSCMVARVLVSPRAFQRWWIAIVVTHCFCGVFLGFAGALYLYLVGSSITIDFAIYSMTVSAEYYEAIAGMYFALASIHGLLVATLVWRSVQARQMVFRKSRRKVVASPLSAVSQSVSRTGSRAKASSARHASSTSMPSTSTAAATTAATASVTTPPAVDGGRPLDKVASARRASATRSLPSQSSVSPQLPPSSPPPLVTPTHQSLWKYMATLRPLRLATHLWHLAMTLAAPFDVRHKHYGLVFLVRELVLTFLQSFQTYRLSCLATQLWMNNLMAGLLVLNCWATPVLHYVLGARVGHARLGGVLVNLALDMVLYIVLPSALLVPYTRYFNQDIKQFDRVFWFTDRWLIDLINEVQLVFVTSLYDAVSKCLIILSVARGLYATTKLICTAESTGLDEVATPRSTARVGIAPVTTHATPTTASTVSVASGADPSQHHDHDQHHPHHPSYYHKLTLHAVDLSSPRALVWRSRIETLGHQLLLLWGLIVLIAHLHAASRSVHPQCRVMTRPWFASKPSCSLLEVNCMEEQTTGTEDEIDAILHAFDPSRVEYLVIRHCAALHVPRRLQTLSGLLGLKLFNSTIAHWGDDAALTGDHHPKLRFLFVVDVKLHGFPLGLQSPAFPQTLRDVEFSRTNLTVIPETLDTIWPQGMFIAFEACQLQDVPHVVLRMRPRDLAMSMNNISTIPLKLLEDMPLRVLLLDGNPIESQSFPSTLVRPPEIVLLSLARTRMGELPQWMDSNVFASTYVVAGDTPLCQRMIDAGEASALETPTLLGMHGRVDCSYGLLENTSALNWYPVDDEAAINPSYSLAS